MRSLLVVVGIALVGCSSAVEGDAPLPACSSAYAGAWKLTMTPRTKDDNGGLPRCDGVADLVKIDLTVNDALSTWTEVNPSTSARFEYKATPPASGASCGHSILKASRAVVDGANTLETQHFMFATIDETSMTGSTFLNVYETAELNENGANATPICRVVFETRATR